MKCSFRRKASEEEPLLNSPPTLIEAEQELDREFNFQIWLLEHRSQQITIQRKEQ